MNEVFISHTGSDKALADALKAALEDLFGRGNLTVHYSSSKEEGGVPAGADWFRWIVERVSHSRVAFVLLTPASVQKPWIPWEAGAVYGAALSRGGDEDPVVPLLFHLDASELPSPFQQIQVTRGDTYADVHSAFRQLLGRLRDVQSDSGWESALLELEATTKRFLARVEAALATAPLTPTEATVGEWCRRLDDLRAQRRASEAKHVQDWLELAFGRTRDEAARPLDLRIHRRLGELYLDAGEASRAAEQFELCRRLAPRDLFVLRSLGQAYLAFDAERAERVIADIEALDGDAFVENAECAALKGRWLRQAKRLDAARDLFADALARNPESHYLAGRLAQTELDLKSPTYKDAYRRVLEIVDALDEQSIWAHADAVNGAVAADLPDDALRHLRAIVALGPTKGELRSIKRGLEQLLGGLGRADELPELMSNAQLDAEI